MLRFPAPTVLRGDSLKDQINAAGYLMVRVVLDQEPNEIIVRALTTEGNEVDGRSRGAIQSIIDAHTGQPSADEVLEQETATAIRAQALLAKCKAVVAGTDTFTAAEVQQVLARLVLHQGRR